jgi:hypothetical protein
MRLNLVWFQSWLKIVMYRWEVAMKNASRLAAPLIMFLALGWAAHAQTITAILEGGVTDPSGGGIGRAVVTVKGPTVQREVVADATGFYRAVALPPGLYSSPLRVRVSPPRVSTASSCSSTARFSSRSPWRSRPSRRR